MAESIIKPKFFVKSWEVSVTSSTATYYKEVTKNVSVSGLTPIGVVGWRNTSALMLEYRVYLSGSTLHVGLAYSKGESTVTNFGSVTAYVLYI